MKIETHKYALAAALTVGIAFSTCAFLMWLWPTRTIKMMGDMLHIQNLDAHLGTNFAVTLVNFASGLGQWMVYTYLLIVAWLTIYNKLL